MKAFYCVLIFFLVPFIASGQNWQKIDSIFSPSGVNVYDFTAPAWGDLDADGDYDLVLGNIESEVEYFENIGTPQQAKFKKDPLMFQSIYAGGYQYTNADYPCLVDLDNDNDLDLVISGYNGLILYANDGDSTAPSWVKVDTMFGSINTEIGTDAKPAFADLDADGDFDIVVGIGESLFGGPTAGISMGYRNVGDAGNPVYLRDDALKYGMLDVGLNAYPSFGDIDGDGDLDCVMGRDGAEIFYYKNNGSKTSPQFIRDFNVFAIVEKTNYWKDPSICDIDGDSDPDLIYGTDNGILYYYQNMGTPNAPQYQHNTDLFQFLKSDGFSTPSFADFDGDGDFDMVSGSMIGQLYYLRNDGSYTSPEFKASASPFTHIGPGFRSAPQFIDYEKDGDFDIVSGFSSGYLDLYTNNNGTFSTINLRIANIKTSYGSIPAFADIDGDGDIDVLVGSDDTDSTKFYLNDKNVFSPVTGYFSGVNFPRGCSPAFCDIDHDGDYDLFLGETFGRVFYYENVGTKNIPQWSKNTQLMAGIETNQNSHPAFSDLDGDGRWDLILGEYNGNFTFYKNLFSVVSVEDFQENTPEDFVLYQNYPNPFNPSTVITFNLPQASHVELKVYDITGKEVAVLLNDNRDAGINQVTFNTENLNLASGVYVYAIKTGDYLSSRKMMLIK